MNFIFRDNLDNIISAYHKYKMYYDRKARAQPLKVNEFVFLLDPKYDSQRSKEECKTFHWKGPYKVMKVLSDSNYIIRKVGTHQTQCVHRMRLRLFKPEFPIDDIKVSKHLYPDTERVEDTDIFDSNIPTNDQHQDLLFNLGDGITLHVHEQPGTRVRCCWQSVIVNQSRHQFSYETGTFHRPVTTAY